MARYYSPRLSPVADQRTGDPVSPKDMVKEEWTGLWVERGTEDKPPPQRRVYKDLQVARIISPFSHEAIRTLSVPDETYLIGQDTVLRFRLLSIVTGAIQTVALSDPSNGTVDNFPIGWITYTPDSGFSGMDSFTLTITDGTGASGTGTITVEVGTLGFADSTYFADGTGFVN